VPAAPADPADPAGHRQIARAWGQRPGVIEAAFLETDSASAVLIEVDNPDACGGDWYAEDVHYIDMCLTRRPRRSRGRFVESAGGYQSAGRIFLAPAGHRLRFASGAGRQQTLGLFLPATAAEAAAVGPCASDEVLWQCLHIWSESIRTPLRRIADELRQPKVASRLIVEGLSLVILGELSRLLQQPRPNLGASGGLANWRLQLIEGMVAADRRPPTVGELAAACQMSPRHLMRAFRNETGQTLGAYVGRAAMERAKRLLGETEIPVAEIGARVGFANPAAFSAAFRRHAGATPSAFRSLARAGAAAELAR
jgi:AraC family transcriptional regulator